MDNYKETNKFLTHLGKLEQIMGSFKTNMRNRSSYVHPSRGILFDISFLILNFYVFLKLGTLLTEEELFKYLFVQHQHLLNLVFKFYKTRNTSWLKSE